MFCILVSKIFQIYFLAISVIISDGGVKWPPQNSSVPANPPSYVKPAAPAPIQPQAPMQQPFRPPQQPQSILKNQDKSYAMQINSSSSMSSSSMTQSSSSFGGSSMPQPMAPPARFPQAPQQNQQRGPAGPAGLPGMSSIPGPRAGTLNSDKYYPLQLLEPDYSSNGSKTWCRYAWLSHWCCLSSFCSLCGLISRSQASSWPRTKFDISQEGKGCAEAARRNWQNSWLW